MATYSTAIANKFLELAEAQRNQLTQMQLQKLVYIANGWNLAVNNAPLVAEDPCAWDYGPVYPNLWEALRKYGKEAVTSPIKYGDYGLGVFADNREETVHADLQPSEESLVKQVYDIYGHFHAFQLSAMTHQEGTPWHNVYVTEGKKKAPISVQSIKEHFLDLAKSRAVVNG